MQDQIDEIMDHFDFSRCERAMDCLDWQWLGQPVTTPMLRQKARELLRDVSENEYMAYCATGGLVARNDAGVLSLTFKLESWECERADGA